MPKVFDKIVEFADQHGFSVERHPAKGFRVWRTEYPLDKLLNPVRQTLADVQEYIEAEVQKEASL